MTEPSNSATPEKPATNDWENEGGSLKPTPHKSLPDGIVAITSVGYRVGPYTYTEYRDALAEHQRQSR